jgi:hypothetical protein
MRDSMTGYGGEVDGLAFGLIAHVVQPVLIGVFTVSALAKLQAFGLFRSTANQLGVPDRLSVPAAAGVVLAEFAAAVGVAVAPGTRWPYLLVVLLAVLFALAGVRALATRRAIACQCFGVSGQFLGWRQVALLPVWIGASWIVAHRPLPWPASVGLAVLAASVGVVGAHRAWRLRNLRAVLRADRVATAHSPG